MTTIHGEYGHFLEKTEQYASFQVGYGVKIIDRQFGDGYAKDHPELLAELIKTMTTQFGLATFAKVVGEFVDAYREGTDKLTSD